MCKLALEKALNLGMSAIHMPFAPYLDMATYFLDALPQLLLLLNCFSDYPLANLL